MNTLIENECPNCSATIKFDSKLKIMKCPYCDSEFRLSSTIVQEEVASEISIDVHQKVDKLNKNVAVILASWLGIFGAHKFYLNEREKGILFAVFFWTLIPMMLSIIDAILLLTMKEEVFDYKYNIYPHSIKQKIDDLELKGNRDKNVAAMLAFFLGVFGVHKFYLNDVGKGILFLVFFWTALPMMLGIIDCIILLTMKKETFDYKYNMYP